MKRVAFLGLGAMGSRMAAQILQAGYALTVWNRTPAAASDLVAKGATLAANPKAAASGADFVIVMVRDDAASQSVWLDTQTGALAGMKPDAIAIDSSTLSHAGICALGQQIRAAGHRFIEAPVSGSRPQADAAQLIFLVGGLAEDVAASSALLATMGSQIHHTGEIGSGALAKLATNTLLGVQVTVLAEIVGMLRRQGADVTQMLAVLAGTAVWSPYLQRAAAPMLAGDFQPLFPVALIEKDLAYMLAACSRSDLAPTIAAAHALFSRAQVQGDGALNLTAVVKQVAG